MFYLIRFSINISGYEAERTTCAFLFFIVLSYNFTESSRSEKEIVLIWKSDDEKVKQAFKSITLHVDPKEKLLSKLIAVDSKENVNTYIFSKTKIGETIPSETFNFTIPKGVEVVDTRD